MSTNEFSPRPVHVQSATSTPADLDSLGHAPDIAESAASHVPLEISSILQMLFAKARPHLTRTELKWVASQGPECVEHMALNAAGIAEGLGCLIGGDGEEGGSNIGSFQSTHDVPNLLFHFCSVFKQIAGLTNVCSEAAFDLQKGDSA